MARRNQDSAWSWPRVLNFLSTEEFQRLPKDIQDIVFTYIEIYHDKEWE